MKLEYDEEEVISVMSGRKRAHVLIESDEECEIDVDESGPSYKKFKSELPEVIEKKSTERPLPHPFPLPNNYRPDVELCLKKKRMTAEARRHFHSAVAGAMFNFKRCVYYYATIDHLFMSVAFPCHVDIPPKRSL